MDCREEFTIHFTDQFEAFLLITNPDRFGYRVERIIKNPPSERQWQSMLCPVGRILVRIKFKVHIFLYVKHIAITIGDRSQAMTVPDTLCLLPQGRRIRSLIRRIRRSWMRVFSAIESIAPSPSYD